MRRRKKKKRRKKQKRKKKDENDLVRIAAKAIASLPHTPPNIVTSMETTSTSEIVRTRVTSIAQSSLATSQF